MPKTVLVIGESCTDVFIYCVSKRKSPEGAGPVLLPISEVYSNGMAANTANNLQALGIDVDITTQQSEIIKTRYVNELTNELYFRVDEFDSVGRLDVSDLSDLDRYDAIIISDYNKGFLTEEDIAKIAESHPLVILDTKKHLGDWCKNVKFIKLNRTETEKNLETIQEKPWLKEKVISTLDADGASYMHQLIPVKKVNVVDISGAGDTFVAGFTKQYLETENVIEAIQFANECASKVVTQRGVATL